MALYHGTKASLIIYLFLFIIHLLFFCAGQVCGGGFGYTTHFFGKNGGVVTLAGGGAYVASQYNSILIVV